MKFPPKLIIQVWDNDIFSPDDFLGKVLAGSWDLGTGRSLLTAFLWAQGSWSWTCVTCPCRPSTPSCALSG